VQAVQLGYATRVIGTIRLAADGTLALGGTVESVRSWITQLQGERTNAEFVQTLSQRSGSLLWMHAVPVEVALAAEPQKDGGLSMPDFPEFKRNPVTGHLVDENGVELHEEIDLNEEEEAALDRAWAKLQARWEAEAAAVASGQIPRESITGNPLLGLENDVRPGNRDWAKRTWNLGIDNVDDLRRFLAIIGRTVEEFMQLPVYLRNVNKPGMEWLRDL
jgi:hypothetical protein